MHSLSNTLSPSSYRKQGARLAIGQAVLVAICLFGRTAKAQTSTYVFDPNQSTVVQTGGIASVHWTYSINGQFQLTVDRDAGTASFAHVDANATDDSPFKRTLDPNHVFNMTGLVGTVLDDATIEFMGKAPDESDILITVTIQDDLAHLIGQTTPPPNSADFFEYKLDAVASKNYSGGTGEPNDPYQIATAEDLILLGETPEDYDKHFILTADIDLDPNLPGRKVFDRAVIAPDTNDVTDSLGHNEFDGIPFIGVFDGDAHTISNLTIVGESYLGLFGGLHYQAKVLDLGIEAVDINGTGNEIGSLAGSNSGSIAGCYSIGTVNGGAVVGGLVGGSDGTITNSHSDGTVKGTGNCVGGLVGINHLLGSIVTCYSTGTISGEDSVGGLAGINISGNIIDSHSICVVSGDQYIGGLVGNNRPASDSYPESRVVNCWSASSVTGSIFVGGLVGCNEDSCITMSYSTGSTVGGDFAGGLVGVNRYGDITMSYSKSTVSGEDRVGGLVGSGTGGITKCYSIGAVIGDELVGGLVGSFDANDVVLSFWDIENSGQATSAGGTGQTTAEMQTASTFLDAGWDIVNVWGIGENQTYPYLRKYSAADINQDGDVDFVDLAVLAENWLAGL